MSHWILSTTGVLASVPGLTGVGGAHLWLPDLDGGYSSARIPAPDGSRWVEIIEGSPDRHAVAVLLPDGAELIGEPVPFASQPSVVDLARAQLLINPASSLLSSIRVDADQVPVARAAGLLLHHEVDFIDWDGDGNEVLARDDWYAATPEWVADYHQSGGTWGYDD